MNFLLVCLLLLAPAALYPQPPARSSLPPGPAGAQTAQEPPAKPAPAEERESTEGQPILTRHDVIVVTATKTETNVLDLPVSVQIVTQKEIQQRQFNNPNVGEVVSTLPGVSVGHGNRNIPPGFICAEPDTSSAGRCRWWTSFPWPNPW